MLERFRNIFWRILDRFPRLTVLLRLRVTLIYVFFVALSLGFVLYIFLQHEQRLYRVTFLESLSEISNIINSCDSNSLILMDELGTGTDPDAGEIRLRSNLLHGGCEHSLILATP